MNCRATVVVAALLISMASTTVTFSQNLLDGIVDILREAGPRYEQPQRIPRTPQRRVRNASELDPRELYTAQNRLIELGYLTGRADGQTGPRTREAVSRFQVDNGFQVTGALTIEQFHALMQNAQPAPPGRITEAPASQSEIPLSRREMADMQRGLLSLGFDIGEADGVSGARTGRAIAKFLQDRGYDPYQTSAQTARELVLEATGMPMRNGEVAEASGDEVESADPGSTFNDWPESHGNYRVDANTMDREILRRVVALRPELLDNDNVLNDWISISTFGAVPTWPDPVMINASRAMNTGTEFDKQSARAAVREFLKSQATSAPMRINLVRNAQLGEYDFNKQQFPIELLGTGGLGGDMQIGRPGYGTIALKSYWKLPAAIPMERAQAETLARRMNEQKSRRIAVVAEVFIPSFRPGVRFSSLDADVTIVSAAIHMPSPRGEGGGPAATLGPVLMKLDVGDVDGASAPIVAGSTVQSWTAFGLPVRNNRVVFDVTQKAESAPALARAIRSLDLGKMKKMPEQLSDLAELAQLYLSPKDRDRAFPRGLDMLALANLQNDPFELHETIERFEREFLPKIKARAAQLPIPVTLKVQVHRGRYNIDAGTFPIGIPQIEKIHEKQLLTDLKRPLPVQIAVENARAKRMTREQASVFYAIDIDVSRKTVSEAPDPSRGSNEYRVYDIMNGKVKRIAIYEDAALERKLIELPVADYLRPPPPEYQPGQAAPKGHFLSFANLAALASSLSGDPTLAEDIIKATQYYQGRNEFDRPDALEAGLGRLRHAAPPEGQPYYVRGRVGLGAYDAEAGAFPIVDFNYQIDDFAGDVQYIGHTTSMFIDNPEGVSRFPIERKAAQELLRNRQNRSFPAILKVLPLRAERSERSGSSQVAQLYVVVDQVLLLDQKKTDRVIASANISTGDELAATSGDGPTLELQPERLRLDRESMVLLIAKYTGAALNDADLRLLFDIRFERERLQPTVETINADFAPWGRFFPVNHRQPTERDVERLMPRFREWTNARIAALPDKLQYEVIYDMLSSQFGTTETDYYEVLAQFGIDRRTFGRNRSHIFSSVLDAVSQKPMTGSTILGMRHANGTRGHADVYMPLPPMPTVPESAFPKAVSIDMNLRKVSVATGDDGKPVLFLDVAPTEVRWWSDRSAITTRTLLGSFEVTVPEQVITPVEIQKPSILGLTIGMPQAEAETILRGQIKVNRVLELKGDVNDPSAVAEYARLYIDENGMDFVAVLYGPIALEPKVYGIARTLFSAPGSVTKGQVLSALINKYGEPADINNWRWGSSLDLPVCSYPGSPDMTNWWGAAVIEGKPLLTQQVSAHLVAQDPVIGREFRLARRLEWLAGGFGLQVATRPDGCSPNLQARFQESYRVGRAGEQIPEADASVLWSWLYDHSVRFDALIAAKSAEKPATKAADIKL